MVLSAKTQQKQTILEIDSINCGVKWLCWGVQSIVHLNVQIQNMETCVRFIYFPFRWVKCGPFDIGTGDPCDKLIEKPSLIVSIDWVALTSLVWLCVHPSPMVMVVMDMVFMDIVDIDMVVSNFPQTRQDYLSFCKLFSYSLLMAEIWPIITQDVGSIPPILNVIHSHPTRRFTYCKTIFVYLYLCTYLCCENDDETI